MPLGERGCCFNCAGGPWRSTLAGQPRVPCTHVCRPGVSRTGPSAQENLRLLLRLPPPPAPLGSSEPRRTGFPQRTACPRQPSRSAHTHGDPTPASTLTRGLCPAPAVPHFFPWECAGQNPKGTHTELKTDAVRCFVPVMAARQSRKPICSPCSRPQVPGHLSCSSQVARLCW